MIEGSARPRSLHVAALALLSEPALVSLLVVVFPVAGDARGRGLLLVQHAGMAGFAPRELVLALELELGVAGMAEPDRLPRHVGVASLAPGSEPASVPFLLVVFLMA